MGCLVDCIHKGDIFRHFKGDEYMVICVGKDTSTTRTMVGYVGVKDGLVWFRDLREFMSEVDKTKYPDVAQKWRFDYVTNVDKDKRSKGVKAYINRMHANCKQFIL